MNRAGKPFRSVILAGERPGGSPISRAFGLAASVMVKVAGRPALARVMQAITDSRLAGGGIICGPPAAAVEQSEELAELLQGPDFEWLAPAAGPAASALAALQRLDHFPALLTSGDHALLSAEIVDEFCARAIPAPGGADKDIVIGFVPHELVRAAYPESRRTVLKFADGGFCGSNLFAVLNPEGMQALRFWRQSEADRKHPWRIARRFGLLALLQYLLRRLTLADALRSLSRAAGCHVGYVRINFAQAAVDVDSVEDQQLAERILSRKD